MTEAMNAAIELHDTYLGFVAQEAETVVIHFTPAFIHKSLGRPGWDDGIGETQACKLVFQSAHVSGIVGDLPSVIFDGELRIGNDIHQNLIILPCKVIGAELELALFLSPDNRKLVITGSGLSISLEGDAEYVEEFSSTTGPH